MPEKKYPKVATGVAAYNDKGEILLVKGTKWTGGWIIPGGHVEWGEKIEDTVIREMKEETNLDVSNIEFLGMQEKIFPGDFYEKRHFIFLDFCCKANSDEIKLNEEATDYMWVKPEDALKLDLVEGTRQLIEIYIEKRK